MSIYIDYTEVANVGNKVGKYNGANSFTREVIADIIKQVTDVKVIVNNCFSPADGFERKLVSDESMLIRTGNITEVDLSNCDVLFLPIAYGYNLLKTAKIRKKNKDLRIYAVVHDRQHNMLSFDPMDRYFCDGIYRSLLISYVIYLLKKAAYNLLYPGFVRSVDMVFTVSNHSIQTLCHKNLKRITCLYQPVSIADNTSQIELRKNEDSEEYILFLNGGRPCKNLGRALLAFREFHKRTDSECKLYIAGIDRDKLYYIGGRLKVPRAFLDDCVRTFDYVDSGELAYLYKNCRYLLFVSKGEGFGLPVLEAIQFGKTTLCSWQSSIPEVAGSILYYVNPYDVDSIVKGMLYLSDDDNLRYREELVDKKKKIIDEQIELDKYVLIKEITG